MRSLFGCAAALGLVAGLSFPAVAQSERCSHENLGIDGLTVVARFCVPTEAAGPNVSVTETFTAVAKTVTKTTPLTVVAGALTSRTIDDVDLTPLGLKGSLHMTLVYRKGAVQLEHALALPGAVPVK